MEDPRNNEAIAGSPKVIKASIALIDVGRSDLASMILTQGPDALARIAQGPPGKGDPGAGRAGGAVSQKKGRVGLDVARAKRPIKRPKGCRPCGQNRPTVDLRVFGDPK